MLRQQEEPFLERLALTISLFSGILFLSVELMAAWTSRSQGVWADSLYDLGENAFLAVFTFLLVFLKENEKRDRVRQIFAVSKNAPLALLLTGLIWGNVRVLLTGGHTIDPHQVWGMELGLCGLAAAVTGLLWLLARGSSSEAVRSEVVCWGCAGMILSYGLCACLGDTVPWLLRYGDSLIALLLSIPALIGVLRMLRDNLESYSVPPEKRKIA